MFVAIPKSEQLTEAIHTEDGILICRQTHNWVPDPSDPPLPDHLAKLIMDPADFAAYQDQLSQSRTASHKSRTLIKALAFQRFHKQAADPASRRILATALRHVRRYHNPRELVDTILKHYFTKGPQAATHAGRIGTKKPPRIKPPELPHYWQQTAAAQAIVTTPTPSRLRFLTPHPFIFGH